MASRKLSQRTTLSVLPLLAADLASSPWLSTSCQFGPMSPFSTIAQNRLPAKLF
jgi:hypothetical protein